MSFDGLYTKAVTKELQDNLTSGRITKIHQPFKNELLLVVRANGKNHKLLISSHPSYARIQLTNEEYKNPDQPPMFCMLLRKHLEGYIIESIDQVDLDRIIIFTIKGRNEIGDLSYKKLVVEIMGRHSNIILVDEKRNIILDSIKHIPMAQNSYRTILPGAPFVFPPKQNKQNPLLATKADILKAIDFNAGKIDQQLVAAFSGLSPLIAKEIIYRAKLMTDEHLTNAFLQLMEEIKNDHYSFVKYEVNNKEFFSYTPLTHLQQEAQTFMSSQEQLDRYYYSKADRDRIKQIASDVERLVTNEKDKLVKKLVKLQKELNDAFKAKTYQLYGELLTANMYQISRGMSQIDVVNYYDEEGSTVTITLDPRKTANENAQKYFSKYQKAKTAQQVINEQLTIAKEELDYFELLLQQIENAKVTDMEEIREELMEQGYLKARLKKGKKQATKVMVEQYVSSDGTTIFVGKNNKQNDHLTNKLAARDDIWLHTKDIPGSHVVIKSQTPSETTLQEAATIAAYFSKAKLSSSVPVDYTQIRHVKKPSGAKPGFVIYDHQKTIYVTPDEGLVIRLKQMK